MTEPEASSPPQSVSSAVKKPAVRRISPKWRYGLAGFLLGVLLLLGIRFVAYQPEHVHYHANFAVYIQGQREIFKDAKYYQEVKVCDLHGVSPQARTHMHDGSSAGSNGVVHVHDSAVTWGQFFENIGWSIGPDFIRAGGTLYTAGGENKLNIVLNGQDLTDVSDISNQVIGDKDRLLLSYGPADQAMLAGQYKSVPASAAEQNSQQDPAACGGSESPTFSERLKHLL